MTNDYYKGMLFTDTEAPLKKLLGKGPHDLVDCECEGLHHCLVDVTPPIVYACLPPKYPNQVRKCINCWATDEQVTVQPEIKEWQRR